VEYEILFSNAREPHKFGDTLFSETAPKRNVEYGQLKKHFLLFFKMETRYDDALL
jgi:hypothetical protein